MTNQPKEGTLERKPKTVRLLFSDEMARAIVEGRKTVTRRPMNVQPLDLRGPPHPGESDAPYMWCDGLDGVRWKPLYGPCAPGDLLIGRECHATEVVHYDAEGTDDDGYEAATAEYVYYRATPREGLRRWLSPAPNGYDRPARMTFLHESTPLEMGPAAKVKQWTPSIHMPDWAARIRRRVISVTVERLSRISEDDAIREGFSAAGNPASEAWRSAGDCFRDTWDSIYAERGLGWVANPYVWRIEFSAENVAVE